MYDPETGEWVDPIEEQAAPEIEPVADEQNGNDDVAGTEVENPETKTQADPGSQKDDGVDKEPEASSDLLERLKKLENQNAALHRRLNKRSKVAPVKAPPPIGDDKAPKIDDFDDAESYNDAKRAYEIDRRVNEQVRKALENDPVGFEEEEREEFKREIVELGPKTYEDFIAVVTDPTLPLTEDLIDAVRTSDNEVVTPADVLYYLGKNKAEAVRLSRLKPTQMARELARIEVKIENSKSKLPPTPKAPSSVEAKKVSTAPSPITPTGSTIVITKDPEKMTQAEYEKWRMSGGSH